MTWQVRPSDSPELTLAFTTGPDPARSRRFRPPAAVVLLGCPLLVGGLVAGGVAVVGPASLPAAADVAPAAADRFDVEVVWPSLLRDGATDDPAVAAAPVDLELSTESVQRRLRAQNHLVGPADGNESRQTRAAVMAFQRVHGLEVDGVVGPLTTAALRGEPVEPMLRGGPDDRIEVDLDLQLLHLVEGGVRTVTFHVSSGNGTEYIASSGNQVPANTPIGEFEIERRVHGVRHANLGVLHDPLYFHRGFAIHGAPSVPAEPASLGCVRVTIADGAWLIDRVTDGMPVHLYGGEHVYTPPGK